MAEEHVHLWRANGDDEQILKEIPGRMSQVTLLRNSLSIATNVGSVVGIVMVNKIIFSNYKYPFGIFLTIVHFVMTTLILFGLMQAGVFEAKRLPPRSVLNLSATFCGFVVLTNLSLKYNSVPFYQMMKVLTTPIVALIQFFGYKITMTMEVKLALGITCFGVFAATMKEVTVSPLGSVIALLSVFVTALYQVLVGAKQRCLEVNSMQLLLYQAPISALMLIVCLPFFESPNAIMTFPYSSGLLINIVGSLILAALVNVSTFLIIGHTSAITYNVVGHCKLCLVLLFGFMLFDHRSLTMVNLVGVLIAFGGIVSYSYIKLTSTKM